MSPHCLSSPSVCVASPRFSMHSGTLFSFLELKRWLCEMTNVWFKLGSEPASWHKQLPDLLVDVFRRAVCVELVHLALSLIV